LETSAAALFSRLGRTWIAAVGVRVRRATTQSSVALASPIVGPCIT
jgi:hypothetical protein